MNAQDTVNAITWIEVDAKADPDARRIMRNERFAIEAAMRTGKGVGAAVNEAKRVASMWGLGSLLRAGQAHAHA
jgi:hypothetical protein